MKPLIYSSFGIVASDIGVGPNRFSRYLFGAVAMGGPAMGAPVGVGGVEVGVSSGGDWDGGHNLSISALYFTLDNYVIPEVRRQFADAGWTEDQIRTEGIRRVKILSLENLKYSMAEMDREPVMEVKWEVVEKDGEQQLFATDYGITLRELWQHTKEYAEKTGKVNAYNPAEERAQLAMEKRITSGDISTDVFAISDPDGIRYIQMWEKNDEGKFVSKQVDVALVTGRDLTEQEGRELIDLIKQKYSDNDITPKDLEYPHVMLENGLVDVQDIEVLVKAQVMFPREAVIVSDAVETITYVAAKTTNEIITTVQKAAEYLVADTTEITLQDLFQDEQKMKPLIVIDEKFIHSLSENELIDLWKIRAQGTFRITPEQSEQLLLEVQETWTMMQDANEVISFVNETGVGIAAGLYALDAMTLTNIPNELSAQQSDTLVETIFESWQETVMEVPMIAFSVETGVAIGGAIAINEKASRLPVSAELFDFIKGKQLEPLQLTEKEHNVIFSFFESSEKVSNISQVVDRETLIETIQFVKTIDQLDVKLQEVAIVQEQEKVEETIVHLWEIIQETILRQTDAPDRRSAILHKPTELVVVGEAEKEEQMQEVGEFSFAFSVWMLLKLINYRSSLISLENIVQKDDGSSLLERIQKEKPEGLIQKETGQTILIAIIWLLAQIREQAMQTNHVPPVQKKKKSKEVLIFLYARDMITV